MTNNIWREFIEQNSGLKELPVILPAVLYHGKRDWNCPRSLVEIMETGEGLEQYIPQFTYDLFDLRDYEDERLLLGSAIGYLGKIHSQETQLEFLEWILRYAYHAREDDLGENIDRGLNALGNENARRVTMTIAERLRQEGRNEGRLEGFQNGQSQIILKLLKKRFGSLSPAIERKLNESGVNVLDRFGESIFDFESLEDAEKWWEDFEKGGNA